MQSDYAILLMSLKGIGSMNYVGTIFIFFLSCKTMIFCQQAPPFINFDYTCLREEMDSFDIVTPTPITDELLERAESGEVHALVSLVTDCCKKKKYDDAQQFFFRTLLRVKQDVACTSDPYVRSFYKALKWALELDFPENCICILNTRSRVIPQYEKALSWLESLITKNKLTPIDWIQELACNNQPIHIDPCSHVIRCYYMQRYKESLSELKKSN